MENTKKISAKLIFIFTVSLALLNCREVDKDEPKNGQVDAPEEIVTLATAKNLYDTYEKRRVDLIQKYEDSIDGFYNDDKVRQEQSTQETQQDPNDPNGERFDVARYVSWDYGTIKAYLKYVEQEAKAAKVDISTLRFYFSNYPPDATSAVHPRQNTIMITPTLHENDREYIYSIDDSDPENPRPILLSDSFGPVKSKGMGDANGKDKRVYASFLPNAEGSSTDYLIFPYQSGNSMTMNRGSGAPPPYHEE